MKRKLSPKRVKAAAVAAKAGVVAAMALAAQAGVIAAPLNEAVKDVLPL